MSVALLHVRLLEAPEDFDRHLGVEFLESVQKSGEAAGSEARGRGEADLSFERASVVRNLADERVVGAKDRLHALERLRAFLRKFQGTGVVPHERNAERLFEPRDRARNVRRESSSAGKVMERFAAPSGPACAFVEGFHRGYSIEKQRKREDLYFARHAKKVCVIRTCGASPLRSKLFPMTNSDRSVRKTHPTQSKGESPCSAMNFSGFPPSTRRRSS